MLLLGAVGMSAEKIVILHTNDTHSAIDPDVTGAGGVLQRKAVIDSVRKAEKNVITVDAGDMVQGSLYFKFFNGDVEYPLMNMTGYDIRVLGNHEFDNGLKELAKFYKNVKSDRLSANYDFSETPLKGMFEPYVIKKIGGKKIGFFGINVNPDGLIAKSNYEGLKFKDILKTANETADMLRNEKKCDVVVMVSHIGVSNKDSGTTDYDVARASHNIDIIIGGHSHTLILPENKGKFPSVVKNADGRDVLVTQTGKYGKYVGEVTIDTDRLGHGDPFEYKLIPVTDRFPQEKLDKKMVEFLKPYRHKVDSVNNNVIAHALYDLNSDNPNGGYANWTADYARWYGNLKLDSLGMSRPVIGLMNIGGVRQNMRKGDVTEGEMLATFPFGNRMVLKEVSGQDFIDAMKVAAGRGGECVSENVRVVLNPDKTVEHVVVDGEIMDPAKTYTICTIDYLAEGNDQLSSLKRGRLLWSDDVIMSVPVLRYVKYINSLGLPIAPDPTGRFVIDPRK